MLIDWLELAEDSPEKFERLDSALKSYELSLKENGAADRAHLLAQCLSSQERSVLTLEMELLDIFYKDSPAGFDGRFGDYIVLNRVAMGGFGVVSKAIDREGDFVALKVAHLSWVIGQTRAEIEAEAETLKELSGHPNIVTLIGSGWHDNAWYIVTEWIDGGALRDALLEVAFPLSQSVEIVSQVCDALEHGHRAGVIHRDVKPGNIMLSEKDGHLHATLLDYGIAKRNDDASSNFVKGSRKYIAPEQFEGKCDKRSDIYALGIVFDNLLKSRFGGNRIPGRAARIRDKATAKNPDNRYASAAEMRDDLRELKQRIESNQSLENGFNTLRTVGVAGATMILALGLWWIGSGLFEHFGSSGNSNTGFSGGPGDQGTQAGLVDQIRPGSSGPGFKSCFSSNGDAYVLLQSEPAGAIVKMYSLNNGEPDVADVIELGKSPGANEIPSGDYLVVALWPDGKWTEVLRRVPHLRTKGTVSVNPLDWFVQNGSALELASIKKPSLSEIGMLACIGFMIDRELITHQCKHVADSSFRSALANLERSGKRLPFAHEIRAASTHFVSSNLEWTCTLHSIQEVAMGEFSIQYGNFLAIASASPEQQWVFPDHAKGIRSYRGVRSTSPFGVTETDAVIAKTSISCLAAFVPPVSQTWRPLVCKSIAFFQ